ncbi:MAG: hypothetical protein WCH34_10810 [Bacteroidota bacterium]
MKNIIIFRYIALIIVLLINNIGFSQCFSNLTSGNQSWGFLPTTVSRIGIGNFATGTALPSTLTVDGNTTLNATSEVFRTYGSATGLNAWRMLTGTKF